MVQGCPRTSVTLWTWDPLPLKGSKGHMGNIQYTHVMGGGLDVPGPHVTLWTWDPLPPAHDTMHYSIWSNTETRDKGVGLRTTVASALLLVNFSGQFWICTHSALPPPLRPQLCGFCGKNLALLRMTRIPDILYESVAERACSESAAFSGLNSSKQYKREYHCRVLKGSR